MDTTPPNALRTALAVGLACGATAVLWSALPGRREGPRGTQEAVARAAAPTDETRTDDWPLVERRLSSMGTWLDIELRAPDRATGLRVSERIVRALEAAESRLSTWRDDSDLARLNAAPIGEFAQASPLLARELDAAWAWCEATDGAFDPAVAPLVEAWALRTGGTQPDALALREAREASGSRHWTRSAEGYRRDHHRTGLEEGAFGKGAGLDAALAEIADEEWHSLAIDFGGQLVDARHARPVERRLADPDDRQRPVLALELASGSLATSGNSERGIVVDGEARSHILDPRTGEPAPDRGSVTVLAPTALAADCLSTACFVMGPDAALAFADAHEGIDVIFLTRGPDGLTAHASAGMAGRLVPLVDDLQLTHSERPAGDERGGSPPSPASLHPETPPRR